MRSLELACCPVPHGCNVEAKSTASHQDLKKQIIELTKVALSNVLALLCYHRPVPEILLFLFLVIAEVFLVAPPEHQLQHEVAKCRQQLLVHRRQEKQISQSLNSIWCELTQIDAWLWTGSVLLAILAACCELLLPSNLVKVIEEEIKLFEDILDQQLDISYPDERVRA
jgi:hypothetical protein